LQCQIAFCRFGPAAVPLNEKPTESPPASGVKRLHRGHWLIELILHAAALRTVVDAVRADWHHTCIACRTHTTGMPWLEIRPPVYQAAIQSPSPVKKGTSDGHPASDRSK
jgi:hypothetical protein